MYPYRKDVLRLASNLAIISGFDVDTVYFWLMDVGHVYKCNPRKLNFAAAPGRIIDTAAPDLNRLESFRPDKPAQDYDGAYYWENRILARQDAYYDD